MALAACLLTSCEKDEETLKELGRKAAEEFCDCYQDNSKDDCLEELKDNYSESEYMSDSFISAFNEESSCGITLEIERISY